MRDVLDLGSQQIQQLSIPIVGERKSAGYNKGAPKWVYTRPASDTRESWTCGRSDLSGMVAKEARARGLAQLTNGPNDRDFRTVQTVIDEDWRQATKGTRRLFYYSFTVDRSHKWAIQGVRPVKRYSVDSVRRAQPVDNLEAKLILSHRGR